MRSNSNNDLDDVIDEDDISFLDSEGKENYDGTYSNGLLMKREVDESHALAEVLSPYPQHHEIDDGFLKDKNSHKFISSTEVLSDNPSTRKDINTLQNQEFNVITNAPKVRRSCEDLKDEIHIISRMEERKTAYNRYGYRSGQNASSSNTQQRGRTRTSSRIRKPLDIHMSESLGSTLTPRYIRLYEIARTKQMKHPLNSKRSLLPKINQMSRLPHLPKPQSSSTSKHLQVYEEAGERKKMIRDASPILSQLQTRSSSAPKRSSSAPNNRHNRLYDLSIKKQQEGRVRREDIVKYLPKPQSYSTTKHLQVYTETGRTKKTMKEVSLISSQFQARSSSAPKRSSSVPNDRHNRLYDLSIKRQQEGRARREDIVKSLLKPQSSSTPKYLQLYEAGRTNKMIRNASPISSQFQARSSSAPNNRHNRLYDLSIKKQKQGRALREDIIKSKQNVSALHRKSQNINIPRAEELFKRKRDSTPFKVLDSTVLDKKACRLYQRGMQSIISLERKRVVAASRTDKPYRSLLLESIRV